jgi:hypothetical protein
MIVEVCKKYHERKTYSTYVYTLTLKGPFGQIGSACTVTVVTLNTPVMIFIAFKFLSHFIQNTIFAMVPLSGQSNLTGRYL